jgi:L-asparagine transporter-like permease
LFSSLVSSRWAKNVHVIHPPWVIGIVVELPLGVIVIVTNLRLFVSVVFWLSTIFTVRIIGVVFSTVGFLVVRSA